MQRCAISALVAACLLDISLAQGPLRDGSLAFVHMPFNFGHTVEKVAMFGPGVAPLAQYILYEGGDKGMVSKHVMNFTWLGAMMNVKPLGEVWGHLNPDLQVRSEITKCPLYYSPPKYWPKEIAEKYFGKKKRVGILRDPYERFVAMFRGNYKGYGGSRGDFFERCDVDGGVRKLIESYLAGDQFMSSCTYIPQSEFFEGPYGIELAVDNRRFPESMNEAFIENGYGDFVISHSEVLHVNGCNNVWSEMLSPETKALVRKAYQADFDLICKKFGYCDFNQSQCLTHIQGMCPENVFQWNPDIQRYIPKSQLLWESSGRRHDFKNPST